MSSLLFSHNPQAFFAALHDIGAPTQLSLFAIYSTMIQTDLEILILIPIILI